MGRGAQRLPPCHQDASAVDITGSSAKPDYWLFHVSCGRTQLHSSIIWRTTTTQLCSQLFSAVALRQLCRVALHKSCVDSHESWFRRCFSLSMSGKAGRAAWMSSSEHNLAEFAPARASLNGRFVVYKSYDDLRRSSCPGGYKRVTARWGA